MSTLRATVLRLALALGLSFAMWAFVSLNQNPEETVTFPEIPLETTGQGEGLVIVDANGLPTAAFPVVSITLRTDRAQRDTLRPVDFRALADLSGLGPGAHIVNVNVRPTRTNVSFELVQGGVTPAAVSVRLEQLSSSAVPVRVEVQGNLPFSFERGEPQATFGGTEISSVQVIGPQSRTSRVAAARADANIEQLRATYLAPLGLTPIDAGGQPVEGVRLEPGTVTVRIPINPVVGLKLVPIEPAIVGLPAPGYEVRGVLVEPPLVALTGSSGTLDQVEVLSTELIDLAGARANLVRTVNIIYPLDTALRQGESQTARVTVQIAPLPLPFQAQLPAQVTVTNVGAGLTAAVSPQVLVLSLTGPSEALVSLAQAPLRALVNVDGLGAGFYTLAAVVELPPGVSLLGEPPSVQVSLRLPQPTPTPTAPSDNGDGEPTPTPGDEPAPTATPEPELTPTPGAATSPTP